MGVARSSRAARAVPLDRAGGQPHSGQPLDHLRDLGGAPDFAVEAVGGWPLQKCLLDQRQLAVGNHWPSGPPVLQPRRAAGAPAGPPADRGLAGDAELPGDRGRRVAGVEQRGRALPPPAGPPPAGGFRRRRPAAEPQTAPSGLPRTARPPAPEASGPWRRCWPRPRRGRRTLAVGWWPPGPGERRRADGQLVSGSKGGGPDGSGPAPTGRVAAPAGTGPQTARDADRRDHSCRWRPLAAAPATPTVQPGWPPVAAGTPPGSRQETQGRGGAAPGHAPGSPPPPSECCPGVGGEAPGLAGRSCTPAFWVGTQPPVSAVCNAHSRTAEFCPPAFLPSPTPPPGSLPPTVQPGDAAAATTPAPALPAQVSSTPPCKNLHGVATDGGHGQGAYGLPGLL